MNIEGFIAPQLSRDREHVGQPLSHFRSLRLRCAHCVIWWSATRLPLRSQAIAQDWSGVALAVARKLGCAQRVTPCRGTHSRGSLVSTSVEATVADSHKNKQRTSDRGRFGNPPWLGNRVRPAH
jgi:hypothetical protein